ncbi:hypothetical protein [Halosolutus halophilus]|uniref:hypothetical protein n=1 Tax=Halosolutus halophilus TaxID=1552990 RepID=UPI0022350ADE|nr:hypothetical protein [Halosolutus halophilus]
MTGPPPRSPASAVLQDDDIELIEKMEEEATDRWGEEWSISIRRWADGDAQIIAEHVAGFEDGYQVKHRLMKGPEGDLGHDVVRVKQREIVSHEVLEYPDGVDEKSG